MPRNLSNFSAENCHRICLVWLQHLGQTEEEKDELTFNNNNRIEEVGSHSHQGRQSGLKTGGVVGPGLKTGGVMGPKHSTDGGT